MDRRVFRSAIANGNLHQNIFRCSFTILDKHIKVTLLVEGVCIDQLELRILFAPAAILFKEPSVGEFFLRILVKHLEIRMRRRGVEVVVKFFNVFAVISLTVREAEKPLFQNRILPVPEGQTQTEALMVVAQTGNAILAPTIGTTAGLVVTEIVPRGPVWTVVLTNRPPLALAQVGTPAAPMCPSAVPLFQPFCFLHDEVFPIA